VADLNGIRARLASARKDVERRLEQRQQPPEEPPTRAARPQSAGLELRHAELEAALSRAEAGREEAERRADALERELSAGGGPTEERHAEMEKAYELLDRELAGARLELEQALIGRDRARAELEAMGAELRKAHFQLEAERAQSELRDEDAGGTKKAERKRRASRSEKRIAELEGELDTERELRKDFELALELLQQQDGDGRRKLEEAERAPLELRPAPNGEGAPEPPVVAAERPPGADPAEGWGVPLEAFPADSPPDEPDGVGKGSSRNDRTGRRAPFRRARRPAGR
jgi:fused signal recognition particle receptor